MLANLSCDPSSSHVLNLPSSPQRPGRDLRRPAGLAPPVLRRLGAARAASHRRAADPGEQLQPAGQRRAPAAALQDPGRPQGPGGESCVDLTLRHSVVEEDTINLKKEALCFLTFPRSKRENALLCALNYLFLFTLEAKCCDKCDDNASKTA